jgi:hypothetical protein
VNELRHPPHRPEVKLVHGDEVHWIERDHLYRVAALVIVEVELDRPLVAPEQLLAVVQEHAGDGTGKERGRRKENGERRISDSLK